MEDVKTVNYVNNLNLNVNRITERESEFMFIVVIFYIEDITIYFRTLTLVQFKEVCKKIYVKCYLDSLSTNAEYCLSVNDIKKNSITI